jgi:hypothetical protein
MSPIPKLYATVGASGAMLGDAALFVVAALQSAGTPSVGDIGAAGATGAATSLAILWFWKGLTDKRLDALEARKADKSSMDDLSDLLREMRGDIKTLMMRGNDHR